MLCALPHKAILHAKNAMMVKKVIIWPNKTKTISQTKTKQLQNVLSEKKKKKLS